jgi:glycosyltransferase involved in cell wall biosynthesis
MRLLIVSHVIHYRHEGRVYAFGPYVREIDIWAELFPEVVVASPVRNEPPPGDSLPYESLNIRMAPQHEGGGESLWPKIKLICWLPVVFFQLAREMAKADAIHVRLPGNLGFFGTMLAPLFSDKLVAKYAGPWPDLPGETKSEILQKKLLRTSWFRGPVTIYGEWAHKQSKLVPFAPSLLTAEQRERARAAAARKQFTDRLRVLYAGRLSSVKQVDTLIKAVVNCRAQGQRIELAVVGDGDERQALEQLTDSLNARDIVRFTGSVPFATVLEHLETSDCLVLASDLEGFGKALAEGMAFGLICIGPNTGIGAQTLAGRGFTATPGNVQELTDILLSICASPDRFAVLRERAAEWAQRFSLEGLKDDLQSLMEKHWNVKLSPRVPPRFEPRARNGFTLGAPSEKHS